MRNGNGKFLGISCSASAIFSTKNTVSYELIVCTTMVQPLNLWGFFLSLKMFTKILTINEPVDYMARAVFITAKRHVKKQVHWYFYANENR